MIGYQCSPAGSMRAPAASPSSPFQPSERTGEQPSGDSVLSTLTSRIHLMKQSAIQKHPTVGGAPSPPQLQAARSPGYHSAASSPSSSVASPVSSSSGSCGSTSAHTAGSTTHQHQHQSHSATTSPSSSSRSVGSPNLLDYYPEINQDGLGLSWFHSANSRSRLSAALMSNKMVVSGDISLAELSRYPVPIMARPGLGVSDITLENWLQEVVHSQPQRGIKLTFTSTRTVEPAFRVLARYAELLKGPLILNADILARPTAPPASGPQQQRSGSAHRQQSGIAGSQPVDAWTFLMLCRTRFPKCTISIGWCGGGSHSASGWPGARCGVQEVAQMPADSSSHSVSADSLFELDILDHSHAALARLHGAGHLPAHRPLPNYPPLGPHPHQQRHSHLIQQQHQLSQHLTSHHHHHHHHHLSSSGSLSSSSGNSSGSPSPTSPLGHLLSPPHQTAPANLSLAASQKGPLDSAEHLFLSSCATGEQKPSQNASKPASSVAAAMAAAVVAATTLQQHQPHQHQPLNLNINEAADQQRSVNQHLAHKVQSYQSLSQQSGSLCPQPNEQQAGKLAFSGQSAGSQHIHKKAALSSSQNSNTPSPQSSSPKSQQHLLLKTTDCGVGYSREMIDKMASLVKEYNLSQPVTFPVEARSARHSLPELQRLLYQVGANSTLTVVAQPEDLIGLDELLTIRRAFAANQILFDLPDDLATLFKQELDLL